MSHSNEVADPTNDGDIQLAGSPELEDLRKEQHADGMGGDPPERSAEGLVAMLKDPDGRVRAQALKEIYPGETVCLVKASAQGGMSMTTPEGMSIAILFTVLVWAAQEAGKMAKMRLKWVEEEPDMQNKLVVAQPGSLPIS